MTLLQKFLNVFITLSLLISPTTMEQVPQLSLWGEVADFTVGCSHWTLKPQVSIPALQELTVCFNLKFKFQATSPWTAFMYSHPEARYTELGLGGKWGHLVVWLFGTEWTSPKITLHQSQWYSLCLTWTHTKDRPSLYIDGNLVDILAETPPSITSCSKLAPNGTLTLGATHRLVNGDIEIIPFPNPVGKLSLFRLWGRERSIQEVTSLKCTEGNLVKWDRDNWDTQICAPLPDSNLKCEWSIYEVRLMFAIFRSDGNNTELYTARDIAHNWLRKVLPNSIYLHRVSVFEVTRSSKEDSLVKTSHEDRLVRWSPPYNRFDALVHVNVIPSVDVAAVQIEMYKDLKDAYPDPSGQLQLLADVDSIHTTPVGRK
ncbi:adhesion G-protein coupled receptor G4-like [Etheostoma cragini]|uniref:adhesion G-protein coupled receptor G4-like n=1 Tax=Etheostoma cragini TaxID=417921 RepID=UPI00155F20B1|nr:adhesion G-protein coupled receptor G4-like [Etheostoma cragini]